MMRIGGHTNYRARTFVFGYFWGKSPDNPILKFESAPASCVYN